MACCDVKLLCTVRMQQNTCEEAPPCCSLSAPPKLKELKYVIVLWQHVVLSASRSNILPSYSLQEKERSPETSVTTYQIIRLHNPEDYNIYFNRCKTSNLRQRNVYIWCPHSGVAEDSNLLGCYAM
jgi:hypothetical protein